MERVALYASLFEAMRRRETFAVSGPHIQVRFFGGWEYGADALAGKDWVKTGYAKGVPMGGDLPPARAKAPTFLVWAVKAPTSGNLDRIQIVKGWTRSGQSFEKVYDVAWAGDRKPDRWTGVVPAVGSTVDVEKGTYTNTIGSVELKATWTDPEFDPALTPSTTRACSRSRRRAGRRSRPRSSASRRPTSWPPRSRSAPGARRSGTRRARRPGRGRSPARRSPG
jgi:hypothetical protein